MQNIASALRDERDGDPMSRGSATTNMIAAIRIAQSAAPGLTLTQLVIFLTVAAEEGLRLNELGDRIGESQSTVSRCVSLLTDTAHRGTARSGSGLLVLLRDRDDGRGRRAALSDEGRRLLDRLETRLRRRG